MKPYLIYIGDYAHFSAGVRVMHQLAHLLNTKAGATAYVWGKGNPEWNEPQITDEMKYSGAIRDMIVVYPEVTYGNPLGASNVVRFVLNQPGLLGGGKNYDANEMVFVYGQDLNRYLPTPAPQLWVPPIEKELFFDAGKERKGGLFWIGKGQLKGEPPIDFTPITYHWPPQRAELAQMLQEATMFISYDNYTCLISEARLCGCPVVVVPDGRFTREEYEQFNGPLYGISWGETEGPEWQRAKATVGLFQKQYAWQEAMFWSQFERFVEMTQERVAVA